jgi:hypothetical protein
MMSREEDKIKAGKEELLKFFEANKMNVKESQITPLDNKRNSNSIPDFKVKLGGKDIVIELTRFFRHNRRKGSPFSMAEDQCQKLEKFISDRWESEIKVGGIMHLKKACECPSKGQFEDFLTEITKLTGSISLLKIKKAQSVIVSFSKRPTIYNRNVKMHIKDYPILANYLKGITIFRNTTYAHSWTFDMFSMGGVQESMRDIQQNYIEKKSNKSREYKQNTNFDELWLLIYFGPLLSQITPPFNLLNRTIGNDFAFKNACKQSGFDRIYLHFVLYKKIICVTNQEDTC